MESLIDYRLPTSLFRQSAGLSGRQQG